MRTGECKSEPIKLYVVFVLVCPLTIFVMVDITRNETNHQTKRPNQEELSEHQQRVILSLYVIFGCYKVYSQ